MSAAVDVDAWDLPDGAGEVLAVYVDGVELAQGRLGGAWRTGEPALAHPIAPARRGETLAEALVWVGRYPPRPTVTALVRRSAGTDVVDARPAA